MPEGAFKTGHIRCMIEMVKSLPSAPVRVTLMSRVTILHTGKGQIERARGRTEFQTELIVENHKPGKRVTMQRCRHKSEDAFKARQMHVA